MENICHGGFILNRIRLFFCMFICIALLNGCSSENNTSKESVTKTTKSENYNSNKNLEKSNKKTLDKVGDSLYDPDTGTVTLNNVKDISDKEVQIGDLKIVFNNIKVITVTDLTDNFKAELEEHFDGKITKFTYAQILYETENTGKDPISWRGFRTAVTQGKHQVNLDFNLYMGLPNPSSIEMLPESKLENNMVWIPVNESESAIRIKAEDVLKNDNNKPDAIVYGKEVSFDI